MSAPKIGVVSCSGEGCVEGTIARIATRLVLEKLRPDNTVTICLPLFLAGEEGERMFAKYFPTIAVDGCDKKCSKKAIEKYSGKTADSIVVSKLLKKWNMKEPKSRRELDEEGVKTALKMAEHIAASMDQIFAAKSKKRSKKNAQV
ncbi:putative zinc-binding protein [Candidatus Bathyarchaeota archaeon]|nr:putative zinc-binding protein [Candidatus Bathyarchaeota archaeon]